MAFDKIVGVDGTTYQFPTLVRQRIADNIEQAGSVENLAVIDALAPALATKSDTTHNHTLASLTSNGIDELGDVEIGVVGSNGIALADKHTLQYESATSKWRNKVASGGVTVGDTRPAEPIPGDAWFDSNDGTLYVYYADGNTNQWVQVKANSALEGTILARLGAVESRATALEAVPAYSPNYVINGGFDIWQRGTTGTYASGSYSGADRWICGSNSTTISRDADVPSGISQYSLKIVASSANSIYQRIESANSSFLAGKTVTLSFYYKRTSGSGNLDARLYYANALDNFSSVTQIGSTEVLSSSPSSSWTRYSTTVTLPSNVINGLQVLINSDGATTSFIDGVQIEVGSVATPFRRAGLTLQGELAACQRYYWRITPSSVYGRYANGYANLSNMILTTFYPPVTMRTAPTSLEANIIAYSDTDATASAATSANLNNAGPSAIGVNFGGTFTQFRPYIIFANNSLNSYIAFNAEL